MDKALQLRVVAAMQDKLSAPLNKVKAGAAGSAQGVAALRDRLKALTAAQREVGEFRDLSRGLQRTQGEMASAQETVRALAQRMREVEAPTRAMQREFDRAVRSAQQLKAQHSQQAQALQGLRGRLSGAGIATDNLSQHERELRQNIGQTNQALAQQVTRLKATSQQQERLARARRNMERGQNVAGGAAMAGAGALGGAYALSRPLNSIVQAFAPAEDAATQLKVSLMGGDGGISKDFEKISALATQLGDKLPGTTADFQNMMTMLRRQGMSSTVILGGLGEATANLGVLLKMPVTDAAEFGAKMQDATRTAETDMMGLMDVIQRTFYIGVDSDNMLQGFTKLSPVLGIIKKEGLEASKMLAPLLVMMDQTGMAGESAGNALRKVFQAGLDAKKVQGANALVKSAGLKVKLDFTDGKGEFGGLDMLFKQLEKLNGLNSVQRTSVLKKLFGDDAETLQVVSTLMSKGIAGYQEVVAKMADQGTLQQRVEAQLGTLQNVAEAAQGTLTNTLSNIGDTVAPDLKSLLNSLGDLAARVGAWVKKNPAFVAAAVKSVAAIAALAAVFGALALSFAAVLGPMVLSRFLLARFGIAVPLLSGVLSGLGNALRFVGGMVLWLGRAFLANPIGAMVTIIGLAAYGIYRYWEPISTFFTGLWANVKAVFDGAVSGISALLSNWNPLAAIASGWASLTGFFGGLMGEIRQAFEGGISGIAALLAGWSPVDSIYRPIAAALASLTLELPARFSEFGSMLMSGLINGITSMAGAVKDSITGLGGDVVGWFKEKLGIQSPSRVFVGLGEFVSQGAAIGIERQQPAAVKAAQALAASVAIAGALGPAPAALAASGTADAAALISGADAAGSRFDTRPAVRASTGGRSVTVAGDTITIQITAAPGMSAEEIGRAVENALRRRDQEKSARVRSAYTDNN